MFDSNKSKYTLASVVVASLLFSLFQNCGSAAPKKSSGDSSDPTVLDTDGPQISIIEKPASLTNETVGTFQLAVSDDRTGVDYVEYQHNSGEWKKIVNMVMLSDLASGDHEVKFKAYDKNKNESKIILYKWIVDTDKPIVTVVAAPATLTSESSFGSSNKMSIKFTSSDRSGIANSVCKINNDVVDCGTNKEFSAPVKLGHHSARILITDTAGNSTSIAKYWSVSAGEAATVIAPNIYKSPVQHNNLSSVEIRFSGAPLSVLPANSSYTCFLDGVAVTPCSPNVANKYEGIKERIVAGKLVAHNYSVHLKHGSQPLVKSAPVLWFTDMTPPTVEFSSTKPSELSLTRDPDFLVVVKDNVAEGSLKVLCELDGAEYAGCLPNVIFKIPVTPGNHVLKIVSQDEAGNLSSTMLMHAWTTASCEAKELALRFPMRGPENTNWSVISFVDADNVQGPVKDWGPRSGSLARTEDQQNKTDIYPGDNVRVFGADFKSRPENAQVVAMAAGKVIEVVQDKIDTSKKGIPSSCETSHFNRVRILHDNGFISHYRHLAQSSVPSDVKVGERVNKGQTIGYAGSSGCLRKPHLAVAVEKCQRGTFADPFAMAMQVDTQAMAYDGIPIIYNLVLHNKVLSTSAEDIKTIMNRTNEYKAAIATTLASGITATFHAAKLTTEKHLMVSVSKKDNTDFKTFSYLPVEVVGNSTGRFVVRSFKPTTKGDWVIRIFHTNGDSCSSTNKNLWKDCVLQAADFVVK